MLPERRIEAALIVSVAVIATVWLVLRYARYIPMLVMVVYCAWTIRTVPELWTVPTPLTDLSIDHQSGKQFSFRGYEFETPWPDAVNVLTNNPQLALTLTDGRRIYFGVNDDADAQSIEQVRSLNYVKDFLGSEATSSNSAFVWRMYSLTPRDLPLLPFHRGEFMVSLLYIATKRVSAPFIKNGLYSFQRDEFRGFQLGDPRNGHAAEILAYGARDREIAITFQGVPKGAQSFSQAEINRVLYTLRSSPALQ